MTTTMSNRYVVKFNNGFWKTFDLQEYKDVQLHYLKKDAQEFCNKLNLKKGV